MFVGGKQYIEYENEEEKDEVEETMTSFFSEMKKDIRRGILSRLVAASCSACDTMAERQKVIDDTKNKTLSQYIVETMGLDKRVAEQMDALVSQVEMVKEICNKKRQTDGTFKSRLDDMVAKVKVEFAPVLNEAAKLTRLHWSKCPVTIPGGKNDRDEGRVPLRVALEAMAGKYKCTNTCDLACCQSLYFVLLCTLALKFENERRRREIPFEEATSLLAGMFFDGDKNEAEAAMKNIRVARREEIVKVTFPKNYNVDTDCLVYLFEPSRVINNIESMSVDTLKGTISSLSESKVTGKIWNHTDKRFFGSLVDRETTAEEEARYCAERELPFVTGIYHTATVEIAAACLSMKL